MIELEGELKKWGNSVGVRLSKRDLSRNKFKLNQKVKLLILPEDNALKKTFGTLKFKKSTEKIMKEIDEGWS